MTEGKGREPWEKARGRAKPEYYSGFTHPAANPEKGYKPDKRQREEKKGL